MADHSTPPADNATPAEAFWVLLVNCPQALRRPLIEALDSLGMAMADDQAPQIILAWLDLHGPEAEAQVRGLREAHRRAMPVITGIVPGAAADDYRRAAEIGLDALASDDDPLALAAQAALVHYSRQRFAEASPLTGLPGAGALEREIRRRLPQRGQMALLAFDLDYFKSYNDRYGYRRGDELLRHAHSAIEQALGAAAGPDSFLAHLGGDDFFALVQPAEAEAVGRRAIELFAAGRDPFYDAEALSAGHIVARARTGEMREFPLVTLTVAAVTNEAEDLQHPGQLAAVLAELKGYAKNLGGGRFVMDRRRLHDAEAAWAARQKDS